jgi:hypothetical protein
MIDRSDQKGYGSEVGFKSPDMDKTYKKSKN